VVYDLLVVGNGIAAQTFLFELFNSEDVKKSQNFSVAQVYSEEITPSCSMRSTATVSLNGIEDGVSDLGDELRDSFFLFQNFYHLYSPTGVEKATQAITYSDDLHKAKMIRRFKKLQINTHSPFKESFEGTKLDSYIINPLMYRSWFESQLSQFKIDRYLYFLKSFSKNIDGTFDCQLFNNQVVKTKKILFCSGAFAKLYSEFFGLKDEFINTQIVPGNYLEKKVDLQMPSFYLTIDELNCIYRTQEKTLIIGSSSMRDATAVADLSQLKKILETFNNFCLIPFGEINDFKLITGLRLKGVRRRPMSCALNPEKTIFTINGLYKNGFSFSHLCAKKILREINLFES
jgi:hypothetical protein